MGKTQASSGKERINTTHHPGHVVVGLCQEWAREQRGLLNSSGLGHSERGQIPHPLLVSCVPALGNPLGPSQET